MGSIDCNSSNPPVLSTCPDCERQNLAKMNWCVACGCLLIGYDPPRNQPSPNFNLQNYSFISSDRMFPPCILPGGENHNVAKNDNFPCNEDPLPDPPTSNVFIPHVTSSMNQNKSFEKQSFNDFELNFGPRNLLQQNCKNIFPTLAFTQSRQRCFSATSEYSHLYSQEAHELFLSNSHSENCMNIEQDFPCNIISHNNFCGIPQHNQSPYFPFSQNLQSHGRNVSEMDDSNVGELSARMLECTAKNEFNCGKFPITHPFMELIQKSDISQCRKDSDLRPRHPHSSFCSLRSRGRGAQNKLCKTRWDRPNNRWSNCESDITASSPENLSQTPPNLDYSNHGGNEHSTSLTLQNSCLDLEMTKNCEHLFDTPEFNNGTFSKFDDSKALGWLSLPTELWCHTLNLLDYVDRAAIAQTCRRMRSIVADRHVWRTIRLDRRYKLTDADLAAIGRKRPQQLHLIHCRGELVTIKGIRQLFTFCGKSLQRLSFVGCSKGAFQGDALLLISALYCQNLSHIDASYTCTIRNRTVMAIAEASTALKSVYLNGAQNITNSAIEHLVRYHKSSLERLELFGCFRLNSKIFTTLGDCQGLKALAFGFLHHLSSAGLLELVAKLPLLASLDLRGTQRLVTDTSLSLLATECPLLEEIILANLSSLTKEDGVITMLHRLPRLRLLDLCGLKVVGDSTIQALAISCPLLEELDISCTSVTKLGLLYLACTPAIYLKSLSTSFCSGITPESLAKVVTSCTRLTRLTLYGFAHIENWNFLFDLRPDIIIKTETQSLKLDKAGVPSV